VVKSLQNAIEEEIFLAKGRGEKQDADGFWRIAVIVDGGWAKRSYGHSFNSKSGVAVIVGRFSGKILFVGVKNSFCTICARTKTLKEEPRPHECAANWRGSAPAMEKSILVEGFRESESHGLRYTTFIGDGDSSAFHAVRTQVSYGKLIKKMECANHCTRNYTTKLYKIYKDTKTYPKNNGGLEARRLLEGNIHVLKNLARSTIRKNAEFLSTSATPESVVTEAVVTLRSQLINGPRHVFGDHTKCPVEHCCVASGEVAAPEKAKQNMELLTKTGMIQDLEKASTSLADKADSLIYDHNSNPAELFMGLVVKATGGKRVDFTKGSGYQTRCYSAVLSYNEGGVCHHSFVLREVHGQDPTTPIRTLSEKRVRIQAAKRRCLQKKRLFTAAQFPSNSSGPSYRSANLDYGELAQQEDVSDVIYEERKREHYDRIAITTVEDQEILALETLGQFENPKFVEQRSLRVSATMWYDIGRHHTAKFNPGKAVHNYLYKNLEVSQGGRMKEALDYGKQNEENAFEAYKAKYNDRYVRNSGLWVSLEHNELCGSPDGLIDDDGVLEIKCPYSARDFETMQEASRKHQIGLKYDKDGNPQLPRSHKYFYQIQAQMYVTGRIFCDFVVWSRQDLVCIRVPRDESYIREKVTKVLEFYKEYILPELVDSRQERGMKLRGDIDNKENSV
jgi:hypothetical protein